MAAYHGKKLADMNDQERARRIQALIAAGNTAAIPTKYLPAHQQQQRLLNARLDAPVVPGSGLTNRGLAHEATAATQLQYGPQQVEMDRQLASAANQPRVTGGYYDQWRQTLADAAKAQQGIGTQMVGQIQGLGSSAQQAAGQQSTSILSALQADAANRGATVDPSLATQAAQGAQVNRGLMDAQAGTAALQSQAQQNYLGALMAGVEAGKIQALNDVAGRTNDLQAKNTELAGEKGAFQVQYKGKRRSEESQNVLNQALAASTISSRDASAKTAAESVKVRKTGQAADDTRADATFAATHEGLTPTEFAAKSPQEQLAILRRVAKATHVGSGGAGSGKDPYGNTRDQRINRTGDWRKVIRNARDVHKAKPGLTVDQVLAAIGPDYATVNQDILLGAIQKATLGHVGAKTAARLKRLGLDPKLFTGKKVRKSSAKGAAPAAPGPGTGSRPT